MKLELREWMFCALPSWGSGGSSYTSLTLCTHSLTLHEWLNFSWYDVYSNLFALVLGRTPET